MSSTPFAQYFSESSEASKRTFSTNPPNCLVIQLNSQLPGTSRSPRQTVLSAVLSDYTFTQLPGH